MEVARFILASTGAGVVGLAVLSRLSVSPRSGPGALGLAFFVGSFSIALWTHLLLWVRIPVSLLSILVGPAILVAIARWRFVRDLVWGRPPASAILIAAASAFLIFGAVSWPLLGVDPDCFYLFKAKSIVHHGTFWNEDFLDPDRLHLAHRRPLLLPCLYADIALLCGSFDGRLIRAWMALLQIGAFGAMYDVLRARTDRATAALGTGLYAWIPALWHDAGGAMTGYADAPLAMLFLLALASEKPLAIFCATAAVLLKDEGAAFVLAFALGRGWRSAVLPAVTAAGWAFTAAFLPLDADYLPRGFLNPHVQQLPFILRKLGGEMLALKHWSLLWPAILLPLAFRLRTFAKLDVRWLAPAALQLVMYIGVWITFPPEVGRMYVRMEDMRLLLHVTPILWAWTLWRAAPLPRGATSGEEPAKRISPGTAV
jgi:hypothetical protein